jgi:hypothetical protein
LVTAENIAKAYQGDPLHQTGLPKLNIDTANETKSRSNFKTENVANRRPPLVAVKTLGRAYGSLTAIPFRE